MPKPTITHVLNCGHLAVLPADSVLIAHHPFGCLECFNACGYEGSRYIAGDEPPPKPPAPPRIADQPDLVPGGPVLYHGTRAEVHGEGTYQGLCSCDERGDSFSKGCDLDFPRFQLAFPGKPGLLLHVRRESFTALRAPGQEPPRRAPERFARAPWR